VLEVHIAGVHHALAGASMVTPTEPRMWPASWNVARIVPSRSRSKGRSMPRASNSAVMSVEFAVFEERILGDAVLDALGLHHVHRVVKHRGRPVPRSPE
jgi:hypothetical protein